MTQSLDLRITLTLPPEGSPSEVLASMALSSKTLHLSHKGDLLADPLSSQERENLRWYLEEYWKWPFEGFHERGKQVEQLLPSIGKRLYHSIFGSPEARQILQVWMRHPAEAHQISIISDLPKVLSLPWELLHTRSGFLALRTRQPISIVRRLPQAISKPHSLPFMPPLRILLVTARPKGTGFVDPRGIARELVDELQGQVEAGAITLEFLRPATFESLRARLRDRKHPIHILHFDGHGMFDSRAGGTGRLAFENSEGWVDEVEAARLAQLLQEGGIPLVMLTACQSAMGADDNVFSSVATQLLHQGVDAVVAMSTSVLVASATRYTEAFYRAIARGATVPVAHEQARQQLQRDPHRHLLQRHLDEEGHPVKVRDWWLPHFYQQRQLTFQFPHSQRTRERLLSSATPLPRLNPEMPPSPQYGFLGRSRELLEIERGLSQGKLVMIAGFGGMGKTALAREAADWFTRTGMYSRACFVSFEQGGDTSALLGTLGHFLGVYDGHYQPQDHAMALTQLAPALKQHSTLVIADNLESLLPNGEAPLPLEARLVLWETLQKLATLKAGVLLTSRDLSMGDGQLMQGKDVVYLPLGGLHPEDAYLLASRLLEKLKVDRACAPYADLRDLLKQLDHHPLAIQLVLPALRFHPLDMIRQKFANLLNQFVDDDITGRNRSLFASLQYSFDLLSEEQRALLPRLALFEGGALEASMLAVTEIPETVWVTLRPAMEQVALLTLEQIPGVTVPFLHFHPVLASFLRGQPGADDPSLCERYFDHYSELADYLYYEDAANPQVVRALTLRELPNLRRSLDYLLERGQSEAATALAFYIISFLNIFGRLRERDELQQRLAREGATSETLTRTEYLHQNSMGEDEFRGGNIQAAHERFSTLLKRVEALPVNAPRGPGSYEHCHILVWLARCLRKAGYSVDAEALLYEALTVIEELLKKQPENERFILQLSVLLTDLGGALRDQGCYQEAHEVYEQSMHLARQQQNTRHQAIVLEQLGALALCERHYDISRKRYTEARELFHALDEPPMEAMAWHQLGMVAEGQQDWAEAERCYRASLALDEHHGNLAGASDSCNQLGTINSYAGRLTEAEGWYRLALKLDEQVRPGSLAQARPLNNLANLLVREVRAGRAKWECLTEARSKAEQALAIMEPLDVSVEIWKILDILAQIAEMEGQTETARAIRLRERETFAAFAGNRHDIDRQRRRMIAAVVAAARGSQQMREAVEAVLPQFEAENWQISTAVQHIWAGKRDWHALTEGIERESALLILRILETLEQSPLQSQEQPDGPVEQLIALVVDAARGDTEAQAVVEPSLSNAEAAGWHVAAPIRSILAGERALLSLIARLDHEETLMIGRILHLLAQLPAIE